jgi:hypothetical protein
VLRPTRLAALPCDKQNGPDQETDPAQSDYADYGWIEINF